MRSSRTILVAVALFGLLAVFPWIGRTFYTDLVTKIMIMLPRSAAVPTAAT